MGKGLLKRISLTVFASAILLSGCAMRPYTVREATHYLEKRYEAKGRFTFMETLEEGRYLFHDSERNVDFIVNSSISGWADNSIIPIPHRSISAGLNHSIMSAYREQAISVSENYDITLIPLEEALTDSIYVSDFSQLNDAALLFFELFELYNLEPVDTFDGGAVFYYCENPATNETRHNAVRIAAFAYCQLSEGKGYLFFENSNELKKKLQEEWRKKEKYNNSLQKSSLRPSSTDISEATDFCGPTARSSIMSHSYCNII
jgi:hypothetical protein